MTPVSKLESIVLYDAESDDLDALDFSYIDDLAESLAAILSAGQPAECVYQPGDGTRYPLVFLPLFLLRHGVPRVVDGVTWERHAVSGVSNPDRRRDDALGAEFYDPTGYLVSWVEHSCYPIRLGGGRGTLAASYVLDHWTDSAMSACALAILFRAVSHHLDSVPVFPSMEAFFLADERRRTSGELDFGVMWTDGPAFPRYRVSAIKDTGEVYAVRLLGGSRIVGPEERVEVLACLTPGTYDDAERLLGGWAETDRHDLGWVRDRLRSR